MNYLSETITLEIFSSSTFLSLIRIYKMNINRNVKWTYCLSRRIFFARIVFCFKNVFHIGSENVWIMQNYKNEIKLSCTNKHGNVMWVLDKKKLAGKMYAHYSLMIKKKRIGHDLNWIVCVCDAILFTRCMLTWFHSCFDTNGKTKNLTVPSCSKMLSFPVSYHIYM